MQSGHASWDERWARSIDEIDQQILEFFSRRGSRTEELLSRVRSLLPGAAKSERPGNTQAGPDICLLIRQRICRLVQLGILAPAGERTRDLPHRTELLHSPMD